MTKERKQEIVLEQLCHWIFDAGLADDMKEMEEYIEKNKSENK